MLQKKNLKSKPVCKVTFVYSDGADVETVHLVGDFNDWDETATPMNQHKNGDVTVTLDLEQGNEYQFRYLVNQTEWRNDIEADKYVASPYGGENSVVTT